MESESNVQRASRCVWQIHYHIVFSVKYREALLDQDVEIIIIETAREISQRYDMEFERIGCAKDHTHLLC
jgi:putative transposase